MSTAVWPSLIREFTIVTIIEAMFDGEVLRPDEPLTLEPNTRVRITIETLPLDGDKQMSFLDTARSLNLEGPPDWSSNLDKYLYDSDTPKNEGLQA